MQNATPAVRTFPLSLHLCSLPHRGSMSDAKWLRSPQRRMQGTMLWIVLSMVGCDRVYDFPHDHTTPEQKIRILDEVVFRGDLGLPIDDIEAPNRGDDMRTILHVAAALGHTEAIRVLLEYGAYVSVDDAKLRTPLHEAAGGGHHSAVSTLLAAGASTLAGDNGGNRPLHVASYHGHKNVVRVLVAAGARLEAKNRAGKTPLYLAFTGGHQDAAQVLLAAGADPTRLPLPTCMYSARIRRRNMCFMVAIIACLVAMIDVSEALTLFGRKPTRPANAARKRRKNIQSSASITDSELERRDREAASSLANMNSVREAVAASVQQVKRKPNKHKQAATAARTKAPLQKRQASDAAATITAVPHNQHATLDVAPSTSHRDTGMFSQEALELEEAQLHKALKDSAREVREQAEPPPVTTDGLNPAGASPEADHTCVVCMHRPQSHIALPCGHLIYCGGCATLMRGKPCALCMNDVSEIKEVFRG